MQEWGRLGGLLATGCAQGVDAVLPRASVSPAGAGEVHRSRRGTSSALSPENALRSLLEALTSPPYAPTQHLEREQALAKQFAEILHFTLSFDELKVPPRATRGGRRAGGVRGVPTLGLCKSCEPAQSLGTPEARFGNPKPAVAPTPAPDMGLPSADDQPRHPE